MLLFTFSARLGCRALKSCCMQMCGQSLSRSWTIARRHNCYESIECVSKSPPPQEAPIPRWLRMGPHRLHTVLERYKRCRTGCHQCLLCRFLEAAASCCKNSTRNTVLVYIGSFFATNERLRYYGFSSSVV